MTTHFQMYLSTHKCKPPSQIQQVPLNMVCQLPLNLDLPVWHIHTKKIRLAEDSSTQNYLVGLIPTIFYRHLIFSHK